MKKTTCLVISAVVFALLLGANVAIALEPIPVKSGFSGFIRPGVGYMRYKSNMVASFMGDDLSDKKINSLTDSPNSESNTLILAPFALQYTFASTRTQLFFGTDLRDLIRFDMSQQLGVKQEIGRFGVLQGGVLFTGIPAKVWKDPYVVDKNRNDTSRTSNGGRLAWDRIFGSNFQLQYTYRKIDIGSEKSGDFLGLSSSDRDRLDRNGDRHVADASYRFNFAKKHQLMPALIYARDDLDGDAIVQLALDAASGVRVSGHNARGPGYEVDILLEDAPRVEQEPPRVGVGVHVLVKLNADVVVGRQGVEGPELVLLHGRQQRASAHIGASVDATLAS